MTTATITVRSLLVKRPAPGLLPMLSIGADCTSCSRRESQHVNNCMLGREPRNGWKPGGVMVVLDEPLMADLRDDEPLSGKTGLLFAALCESAGFSRDDVYVTYAVACTSPKGAQGGLKGKELDALTANAVRACLGRLQWEIMQARPRIILTLGNAALLAVTGRRKEYARAAHFACSVCGIGPRFKGCAECKGRKTRTELVPTYTTTHRTAHVAGAVFDAAEANDWLIAAGVRYVIPTFNPSLLLMSAETEAAARIGGQYIAPTVVAHLVKAKNLLTRERDWALQTTVTDIPEDVIAFTQDAVEYAIDIETDAKEPFDVTTIRCIGIGRLDSPEVLVVDTSAVTDLQDPLILALKAFLEDPTKGKILQNRQYDELVIELRWGHIVAGTTFDTMLAHHALCPDEPHNLQRIATTYTESPAWKPPKNKNGMEAFADMDEFWLYNARDVRNTALSARAMRTELRIEQLTQVHKVDLRMSTIAMEMQRVGVPLDEARRMVMGEEHRRLRDEALQELREAVEGWRIPRAESVESLREMGDDAAAELQKVLNEGADPGAFNPASQTQLRWALFDPQGPCKLRSLMNTDKARLPSTSRPAVRAHNEHPFVRALLRYRDSKRIVSNFIDSNGFRIGPDGRVHPAWRPQGARTGRWSSSPNFQNLDELIRAIFVSRPGWSWVGADESQLEQRILAGLSGDPALSKLCLEADESDKLNPDKDPHSNVARLAFGRAFEMADEKGRKAFRAGIKAVVYATNYGAGARKIHAGIQNDEDYQGPPMSVELVDGIMRAYFKAFPRVRDWREQAVQAAGRDKAVYSPLLRRRRQFPLGEIDGTIAMNFPIQSCAADIVNDAMDAFYTGLSTVSPGAAPLMQVHDAIYAECPDADVDAVKKHLEASMYRVLRLRGDQGPEMEFVAKAKSGPSLSSVS